jgi:hypothetical protein
LHLPGLRWLKNVGAVGGIDGHRAGYRFLLFLITLYATT